MPGSLVQRVTIGRPARVQRIRLYADRVTEERRLSEGTLVLVEMDARRPAGHWVTAIPLLAKAAFDQGMGCVLVTAPGEPGAAPLGTELTGGAEVVTPESDVAGAGTWARVLWAGARLLDGIRRRLPARGRPARIADQCLIFSRCLADAAAIRLGHALAEQPAVVVLIGARSNLPATTAALGGAHIRVLHYVRWSEGRLRGGLEHVLRRYLRRVGGVATTNAVSRAVGPGHLPGATVVTEAFTLLEEGGHVGGQEHAAAAAELGVAGGPQVVSVIGGWRASKDVATLAEAIGLVSSPFTLLIAGAPLDDRVLAEIRERHRGPLRVVDHVLSATEYRQAFAASDMTIVSRFESGQESGLGIHALMYGVPLVIADHEAIVTDSRTEQPWVIPFAAGDAASLAAAIERCLAHPPPRPPADSARAVNAVSPGEKLLTFKALQAKVSR